jgi:hypothetical protein
MYLRHMIDTITIIGIVALFMVQMINFIGRMNESLSKADFLLILNNAGNDRFSDSYQMQNRDLNSSLDQTAFYHDLVIYIIIACYLNGPISILAKMYFVRKTNRTKIETNTNDYIDVALCIMILVWL